MHTIIRTACGGRGAFLRALSVCAALFCTELNAQDPTEIQNPAEADAGYVNFNFDLAQYLENSDELAC